MTDASAFALALLSLDGVGRVTAHRILDRFPSAEALRAVPREQVLLRLKGAPRADRTVETLFSDTLDDAIAEARTAMERLSKKAIRVLAPGTSEWPSGLNDLDRADRPVVLYAYGHAQALARPLLSVLGRPPVPGRPFEAAQRVARRAAEARLGAAVGMASGFDVAVQKVMVGARAAPVAVVGCGLANLAPSLRPSATALVRGGGLLLSPFPMTHGPFPHDDRERALVQTAMARAVFIAAPQDDSPEMRAAVWAMKAGRKVAVVGDEPQDAFAEALRADEKQADDTVLGWLA